MKARCLEVIALKKRINTKSNITPGILDETAVVVELCSAVLTCAQRLQVMCNIAFLPASPSLSSLMLGAGV